MKPRGPAGGLETNGWRISDGDDWGSGRGFLPGYFCCFASSTIFHTKLALLNSFRLLLISLTFVYIHF